jgi:hypothetical protein
LPTSLAKFVDHLPEEHLLEPFESAGYRHAIEEPMIGEQRDESSAIALKRPVRQACGEGAWVQPVIGGMAGECGDAKGAHPLGTLSRGGVKIPPEHAPPQPSRQPGKLLLTTKHGLDRFAGVAADLGLKLR